MEPATKVKDPPKKRCRKINDMLREQDADRSETSDEEEDSCASKSCKIKDGNGDDKISWVFCDSCTRWFHTLCVGLADLTDEELDDNFECKECAKRNKKQTKSVSKYVLLSLSFLKGFLHRKRTFDML